MTFKKMLFAMFTCFSLCLTLPAVAHADWYHHDNRPVVGLSIQLGDNDFADRWNHSDVNDRGRFCHDVRHDCDRDGGHSRACHLKWQYCTPHHQDYGYYFNR